MNTKMFKIQKYQLPLMFGFCLTSDKVQRQTLDYLIIDI